MSRRVLATMTIATVVAITGLAAGLTACSSAAAESSRSDPPRAMTAVSTRGGGAPDAADARTAVPPAARRLQCPAVSGPAEPVPAGFTPIAVVECVRVTVTLPGGAVRTEEKRQVAVAGLGSFLHALRLQKDPRGGAMPACLVLTPPVAWLALVDSHGQVIHPAIPAVSCSMPVQPVWKSLRSLRWITLGFAPAPRILPIDPSVAPSDDVLSGRPPLEGGPVHRLTPGSPASSPAS